MTSDRIFPHLPQLIVHTNNLQQMVRVYHSQRTKFAAFNSFCYKAVNVPLNENNFNDEVDKIYKIADVNGYSHKIVDNLLTKHQQKRELKNLTTLSPLNDSVDDGILCYTGGIFVNGLTPSMSRIFSQHSMTLSPNSTCYNLKTHLGSTKDKVDVFSKSGIYSVLCCDCEKVYIGQSRRAVCVRCGEHYRPFHEGIFGKSTPADHMLENNHKFAGFRPSKEVNNPNYLDAYENLYIYKTRGINMNTQDAQAVSPLYRFTKQLTADDIFNGKN